MKISLRMNLSDFINKENERDVINKLEDVHNDDIKYYLTLWYKDGTVSPEDIKKFLLEYESNLHFKTNIVVGDTLKPNDFIWYDITDKYGLDGNQVRFQYTYSKPESILKGLDEFHKCAKFCSSDKPPKRQKRNDYESSDSRK